MQKYKILGPTKSTKIIHQCLSVNLYLREGNGRLCSWLDMLRGSTPSRFHRVNLDGDLFGSFYFGY